MDLQNGISTDGNQRFAVHPLCYVAALVLACLSVIPVAGMPLPDKSRWDHTFIIISSIVGSFACLTVSGYAVVVPIWLGTRSRRAATITFLAVTLFITAGSIAGGLLLKRAAEREAATARIDRELTVLFEDMTVQYDQIEKAAASVPFRKVYSADGPPVSREEIRTMRSGIGEVIFAMTVYEESLRDLPDTIRARFQQEELEDPIFREILEDRIGWYRLGLVGTLKDLEDRKLELELGDKLLGILETHHGHWHYHADGTVIFDKTVSPFDVATFQEGNSAYQRMRE